MKMVAISSEGVEHSDVDRDQVKRTVFLGMLMRYCYRRCDSPRDVVGGFFLGGRKLGESGVGVGRRR